jgi:ADP-ribose pyrophosphatase YjhB (NUDIX family)
MQLIKHCPTCGHTVQYRVPPGDERERAVCESCGEVHYQNPRIIAGCVVDCAGRLLLCRRAIEPRRGYWTHPAGFMELGETLQDAALRETREEALAHVQLGSMLSVTNVLHTGQVHIYFRATLSEPVYGCGTESLEVRLFDEAEIPWDEIAFRSVEFSLRHYLDDRRAGRESLHFLDIP